jgi:hypothetical protein
MPSGIPVGMTLKLDYWDKVMDGYSLSNTHFQLLKNAQSFLRSRIGTPPSTDDALPPKRYF